MLTIRQYHWCTLQKVKELRRRPPTRTGLDPATFAAYTPVNTHGHVALYVRTYVRTLKGLERVARYRCELRRAEALRPIVQKLQVGTTNVGLLTAAVRGVPVRARTPASPAPDRRSSYARICSEDLTRTREY